MHQGLQVAPQQNLENTVTLQELCPLLSGGYCSLKHQKNSSIAFPRLVSTRLQLLSDKEGIVAGFLLSSLTVFQKSLMLDGFRFLKNFSLLVRSLTSHTLQSQEIGGCGLRDKLVRRRVKTLFLCCLYAINARGLPECL